MNSLRTFVLWLAITFALPWLILVVIPAFKSVSLGSVKYDTVVDDIEVTKIYPESSVFTNGENIYRAEGCANCHTQVIRPIYAGLDTNRGNWGRTDGGFARPSRARDYLGEDYAQIGYRRVGPDLSSVGYRITDAQTHHQHLYDPRSVAAYSTMPSFRHLYERREIQGRPSLNAVHVEDGFEVVPTDKAKALVQYLLSLKKDSDAPTKASKAVEATEEAPAAPAATDA